MILQITDDFEWWAIKLMLVNLAAFGLSVAFPGLTGSLALVSSEVLQRPWTIVTHMFMHSGLPHLYFNMFALAVFGSIFEKQVGSRTFLAVFFMGGLAASVADIIFYPSTVGASGAIFAVLGALAFYRPRTVVWALGVPMFALVALVFWAAADLLGLFSPDGIAHASHLAGMAYGGAYGLWLRRERPQPPPPRKEADDDLPTDKELDEWERTWMRRS